jgi:hypothetical protein
MSPELSIIKVPPIDAGTVVIPRTTSEGIIYLLTTEDNQLFGWASVNIVCKLTLEALDAVTVTSLL